MKHALARDMWDGNEILYWPDIPAIHLGEAARTNQGFERTLPLLPNSRRIKTLLIRATLPTFAWYCFSTWESWIDPRPAREHAVSGTAQKRVSGSRERAGAPRRKCGALP